MYNDQLEEITVSVTDLYLDPNNPRFWSEQTRSSGDVADLKVPEDIHQTRAMERIKSHGLEELRNSMLRNGFLPLDRIVVRELAGCPGKYIVIEGNRRLAALKALREAIQLGTVSEEGITDEYLDNLFKRTDTIEVLVYRGDETKDIAWILQGIRHIGGIRDWMPAQQGKLVADQIDREGLSLTEAGQRFGLSAQAVGRRYRSYKALEQMRKDSEFQSQAENKYYSLFEEAIRQKEVKKWLGWSDQESRFTEPENLKQFYAWITPDEEHEDKLRRIHDPRQIQYLGKLLSSKQDSLLDQIDRHEIEIEAAHQKLKDVDFKFDWRTALLKAEELINDIPGSSFAENPEEVIANLDRIMKKIEKLSSMAVAVIEKNGVNKI
ncbi:MAG: ParB N-terminal domain-containing protein [Luteolibacter sp.]